MDVELQTVQATVAHSVVAERDVADHEIKAAHVGRIFDTAVAHHGAIIGIDLDSHCRGQRVDFHHVDVRRFTQIVGHAPDEMTVTTRGLDDCTAGKASAAHHLPHGPNHFGLCVVGRQDRVLRLSVFAWAQEFGQATARLGVLRVFGKDLG